MPIVWYKSLLYQATSWKTARRVVAKVEFHAGLDWQDYVQIDPTYRRPLEVDCLLADATKAKQKLDWKPKITFS